MELFLSEILNFRNNNVDCYYHEIQKEEIFSNDQSMILEDLAHICNLFLIKNFLKDNFITQDHPKSIQKDLSMTQKIYKKIYQWNYRKKIFIKIKVYVQI